MEVPISIVNINVSSVSFGNKCVMSTKIIKEKTTTTKKHMQSSMAVTITYFHYTIILAKRIYNNNIITISIEILNNKKKL